MSLLLSAVVVEVRQPALLADYAHHSAGKGAPRGHRGDPLELVVSELQKRVTPAMTFEIPDGSTQLPPEDTLLKAMHQLNEVVKAEEERFLAKLGVRFQARFLSRDKGGGTEGGQGGTRRDKGGQGKGWTGKAAESLLSRVLRRGSLAHVDGPELTRAAELPS